MINIDLKNCAFQTFENDESYLGITSSFFRLYHVLEGQGKLIIENQVYDLIPGHNYLIPSFSNCSYYFKSGLKQYYVHFNANDQNTIPISMSFELKRNCKSAKTDATLLKDLIDNHPHFDLKNTKPEMYESEYWKNKKNYYSSPSNHVAAQGILILILSRFITGKKKRVPFNSPKNFLPLIEYIYQNLNRPLTLSILCEMAHMPKKQLRSTFSKVFNQNPSAFILKIRLEKAIHLLTNTELTAQDIWNWTGFKSFSYFSQK